MSLNDVYLANDVLINRNLSVSGAFNIDNTRGTSDSVFKLQNNSEQYATGIDQSDSNTFVVSNSTTLGTDNISRFDSSQNILLYNNLNVNGQVSLKDPIIQLNNDSDTTSGNWYGIGFKRNLTDITSTDSSSATGTSPNVGNTTTTIQLASVTGTGVSQEADDFYNGWYIELTSGPASGNIRLITDFVSSTALATVSPAFSAVPGANTYQIEADLHPFMGYNETSDTFNLGYSTDINLSNPTQTLARNITRINNANTFIGINAGNNVSSGTGNLLVGSNAVRRNTVMGNNNIGIGNGILNNTTAVSNTIVIGSQSTVATLSTSNQIIIGRRSAQISNGLERVCVGASILNNSAFASDYTVALGDSIIFDNSASTLRNTACGSSAMLDISSSDNTAIGRLAGASSTTGSSIGSNTSIGYATGQSLNDGLYNVMIGVSAGDSITTGDNNTLIGQIAGTAITTSNNNTIIGPRAGSTLTGSDNTMIGNRAGRDFTSSDRCIAIGNNVGAAGGISIIPNNLTLIGSSITLLDTLNDVSSNCVLIGNDIEIDNTSNTNTIIIGNTSVSTRSRVICIGYNSETPTSATFTDFKGAMIGSRADMGVADLENSNVIGYRARGTVSNAICLGSVNTVNSATVTHKVGRGTTAPTEALHIHDPDGAVAIKVSSDASGGSNDIKFQWTADDNGTPTSWSAGIDASDTNAWVLSTGTALGTNNAIKVDTSQNVTMPTGTTTTNIVSSSAGMVLKGENTLWKLYSTTANTTVTLSYTAALLNKGIIVRNPAGTSTDTLPTGTAMDTGRPTYANDGSDYHFKMYIINASASALTMAGNTGFTYIGNTTISANSTVLLRIARTGTNTWQALRS